MERTGLANGTTAAKNDKGYVFIFSPSIAERSFDTKANGLWVVESRETSQ